ncbi:hypothetical protein ACWXWU_01595 [Shewanella sp. A14]
MILGHAHGVGHKLGKWIAESRMSEDINLSTQGKMEMTAGCRMDKSMDGLVWPLS